MTATFKTSRIAQNLFAYGASEVAAKASRLLVVVVVARSLDLTQIGVALYAAGGSLELLFLILLRAGEYLFMPAGLVQTALAMRAGKLRQTAAISGAQNVGANLLSAVLAMFWPSALALILPRLLTAPFWLVAMRRLHPWKIDVSHGRAPLRPFVSFGWAVLGVELVKAMRLQADKLIVGGLMGAEALGLYFMAFNAGLSLANSFSVAFSTVLFPHLCAHEDKALALRQGTLLAMALITPAVVLQALLAPFYVPVLLGDGWTGLEDIVSILCLVAIPGTLWSATAGWLRATGQAAREFWVTAAMTAALMANTVLLSSHGLVAVATGYAVVATVVMVAASLPVLSLAFGRSFARI